MTSFLLEYTSIYFETDFQLNRCATRIPLSRLAPPPAETMGIRAQERDRGITQFRRTRLSGAVMQNPIIYGSRRPTIIIIALPREIYARTYACNYIIISYSRRVSKTARKRT